MARDTKARKVGTVTVLFTDLVGSTEMLDRVGDDAADRLRRRHFRLLRQAVRAYGGLEVKSLGDGLMIVFSSAYDAAACAVAIQKTSALDPDQPEIRVGLHSGEVAREEEDVFGTPVVVARRLCDGAMAGQILVSDLVRNLLGTRGGFSFRDVGFMELKGLRAPVLASEILLPEEIEPIPRPDTKPKKVHRLGRKQGVAIALGLLVAGIAVVALLPGSREASGDGDSEGAIENTQAGAGLLRWTRSAPGEGFRGIREQVMLNVVAHDSTLIAPGRDGRAGDADAVVWRQGPRGTWTEVFLDPPEDRTGEQAATDISSRGHRLVAVGLAGSPGNWDWAAWISRNRGSTWRRIPDPDPATPGIQAINRVAQSRFGLAAVGYETFVPGDSDGAVWVSETGTSWTRIEDPSGVFGGDGEQEIKDVVATRDGFFAVGRAETTAEGEESDAAVWFSRTGNTWERVGQESLHSPGFQVMRAVISGGPGYIAAGYDTLVGNADAALWTSRDGITWQRVARSDLLFGGAGSQVINALARDQNLYIAAGLDGSEGDADDAGYWVSTNGLRWKRGSEEAVLGGDLGQEIKGVVMIGDRIVAVGGDEEAGDLDAAVWGAGVRRP